MDQNLLKGKLNLSQRSLCFDSAFSVGENKVVLDIKKIYEATKVHMSVNLDLSHNFQTEELKGIGNSITFIMYDAKVAIVFMRCVLIPRLAGRI